MLRQLPIRLGIFTFESTFIMTQYLEVSTLYPIKRVSWVRWARVQPKWIDDLCASQLIKTRVDNPTLHFGRTIEFVLKFLVDVLPTYFLLRRHNPWISLSPLSFYIRLLKAPNKWKQVRCQIILNQWLVVTPTSLAYYSWYQVLFPRLSGPDDFHWNGWPCHQVRVGSMYGICSSPCRIGAPPEFRSGPSICIMICREKLNMTFNSSFEDLCPYFFLRFTKMLTC